MAFTLHKNWNKIFAFAEINYLLALVLILAKDEETLERLAKSWPEMFCRRKPKLKVPVPLSVIRMATIQYLSKNCPDSQSEEWERELVNGGYELDLYLPKVGEPLPLPDEVARQLVGQRYGFPMRFNHHGVEYLVMLPFFVFPGKGENSKDFGEFQIGETITVPPIIGDIACVGEDKKDLVGMICLTPAALIDLNS